MAAPSGESLRVGMVTPRLPPANVNATGSPAHILKTRGALERRGLQVLMLELNLDGVDHPLRLMRVVSRFLAELRVARPDILHVHGHIAGALALPAAWLLNLPMIIEIHGLYVRSRASQAGARPLLSRAAMALEIPTLRAADHVVVQALTMRDRLVRLRLPAHRITVLYPGLRTAEFSEYSGPPAEMPGTLEGEKIVLYVGSTHHFQGLDLLAAAQRRLPLGFRVVLVLSRDGHVPSDVMSRFGFDPKRTTTLHPESSGVIPALCRRADVLVHARPDVPDNINVQSKLGLYLAAGRPIATTDLGDYRALLGSSLGCVLTRPEPEALSSGIVAAMLPHVAVAAARANPALARTFFELDTNARQLVALYEVLAVRRARAAAGGI